jgi:ABC-type multidrug transport system fused ATPase/permease subunit
MCLNESLPGGPIRLVLRTANLALSRREKLQLFVVGVLVVVGVGLELATLSLFVPAIGVLTSQGSLDDLRSRFSPLAEFSDTSVLVVMLYSLTLLFLLKNLYAIAAIWYQRTVIARISTRLSTRLFETYIQQPYEFHLKSNSSVLIRNMQNAAALVSSGIEPLIGLFTEVLIASGIVTLLMIVAPLPSIFVVFVVGILGFGLHRFVRARVVDLGGRRNMHNAMTLKHQQQGLGAIKTLKITGRESLFVESYSHHVIENNLINRTYGLLQQIPRLWIETLTVLGLSGLVLILNSQGREFGDAIPILGLFGIAAFRIQPSVTKLLLSLQALSFSSAAVDSVRMDLTLGVGREVETESKDIEFEELSFENVSFAYSSRSAAVLEDVSFTIRRGEYVGIAGRSGAGKSTLADLILGLLDPVQGRVAINGCDLRDQRRAWQRQIGFVPQDIYLIDDSIACNVSFGLPLTDEVLASVNRAVAEAQLGEFIDSLPDGLDTLVGEKGVRLSGGQRQRVGIARALLGAPTVMIFDEATSSLDGETEREVLTAIESVAAARTVIVVAHRTSTLAVCDRILRVEDRGVVDLGPPSRDLLARLAGELDDAP